MSGQTGKNAARANNSESGERTLIYIPIIHTQADMGALSRSIERLKIKKLGKHGWERNVNLVAQLWAQIEQVIEKLVLPYSRVRIYQDGLPVCGREMEIVTELANAGSRNHRLLLRLRDKGATVMGTESSELLVEEYQFVKEEFASGKADASQRSESPRKALKDSLLRRRDQYIARRISDTLRVEETGLLFLGMLHSIRPWLDKDVRLIYPLQPAFNRGEE
jgi:hypothetical protein